MKHCIYFLLFFLIGATIDATAQDTLYYKNGSKQIVKVIEVGLDDLKYRDFLNIDAPIFMVSKSEIYRVVFADGNKLFFEEDPLSLEPSAESLKKTNAIKFEFLSPLAGALAFGMENMIKKGVSLETKIGIIGAGFDPQEINPGGAYLKAGVKFMSSPDYYVRGMKRTHQLRGGYIKPEIIFSKYAIDRQANMPFAPSQVVRVDYTNFAFNLVFGKQRILGEIMTFDWYVGVGYGTQTNNFNSQTHSTTDEDESWFAKAYSHTYGGPRSPITISGGLTFGFLFK